MMFTKIECATIYVHFCTKVYSLNSQATISKCDCSTILILSLLISSERFYHYILNLYFSLKQQAVDAIQGLNGKLALSKPLIVNWAKKPTGRNVRILLS